MTLWGADLPAALLILAALFCAVWGWIASIRHGRAIREMAVWLERHRAEAWNALPWATRRLLPQGGIMALKRQGLTDDPHFRALEAQARRLHRQFALRLFAGLAAIGLVFVGKTYLGWVM
jgi:hypothetical protein